MLFKLKKEHQTIYINNDTKIAIISLDNNIVGWINFKEIQNPNSLTDFVFLYQEHKNLYLLHNFYIIPEQRNNGFGKLLFQYIINYLIDSKATKIYLIPDPFEVEIKNNEIKEKKLSVLENEINLEKLINFYSRFDFNFVNDSDQAQKLLEAFNFNGKTYRLMKHEI